MKSLKTQTRDFAFICFAVGAAFIALSLLSGCGQDFKGPQGEEGSQGNGAGILTVEETNACAGNGGVEVVTFVDPSNTGVYEADDYITSTSLVCNGSVGAHGVTGNDGTSSTTAVTEANETECPAGGYILTITNGNDTSISNVVCNGEVGATGSAGTNGNGCSVSTVQASVETPNGGSLIVCGNAQSLVLNGTPGVQGNVGATGATGSPGTIITPVQFCPASTEYSSVFSEIGFCIDNNIWAVYSENGGFLTEVVPGEYSSDGINSSCTFTVEAGCVVVDNWGGMGQN